MHRILITSFLMGGGAVFAAQSLFPSGLVREFEVSAPSTREVMSEQSAIESFRREYFGYLDSDFRWSQVKEVTDTTHIHRTYQLEFRGRRVANYLLRTHYNRQGWLQYVSSSVERKFHLVWDRSREKENRRFLEREWEKNYRLLYPKAKMKISAESIVWIPPKEGRAIAAAEITITVYGPRVFRSVIVDENSREVLQETRVLRQATNISNVPVYLESPSYAAPGNQTLLNLEDPGTKLKTSYFRVRREQNTSSPTVVDVNPNVNYFTDLGFSSDPASYAYTCTGGSSACPNQAFDALNIYYHLYTYRERLEIYFQTLGVTSQVSSALRDPLEVVINGLYDSYGSGEFDSNNAFYTSSPCIEGNSSPCLIFLKPGVESAGSCRGAQLHHVTREANVVVHEYQHYFTDKIAAFQRSDTSTHNVADALHEGFSDYLAASQALALSGDSGTKIGEYAFQNCSSVIRDVSTLRVYQNGSAEKDEHLAGLSWASGLWQLHQELGRTTADLLAIKSLFFMSTNPSFMEAVEALVKADTALNAAANVGRIRTLFYKEIRFIGGESGVFRDVEKRLIEIGFQSCAAVPAARVPAAGGVMMILWLLVTLVGGRVWMGFRR